MSEVDGTACADAYRALRARVTTLLDGADPALLDTVAPATPEWRVRDVLAHMVGVNADILAGNLEGVASDEWTQAQVDARADTSVAEMLAEWNEISPAVEEIAPMFGPATGQWLFDACTHEHDLRQALAAPGARDSDAVVLGFDWITGRLDAALRAAGTTGAVIVTEAGETSVGATTDTVVRTTRFEVVRAITGRRSRTQIAAYAWEGPARPEVFGGIAMFTLRSDDFVE